MGVQIIGDRKTRHAQERLEMEVIRALRIDNHTWDVFVRCGDGHRHVRVDPKTWEWEWRDACGYSTCGAGEWGERVPLEMLEVHVTTP